MQISKETWSLYNLTPLTLQVSNQRPISLDDAFMDRQLTAGPGPESECSAPTYLKLDEKLSNYPSTTFMRKDN